MNKQELINNAVEELKGKLPEDTACLGPKYLRHGGVIIVRAPNVTYYETLCWTSEYESRARELGWCNGYKGGEEYPTNGKKPDLPDDVIIQGHYTFVSIEEAVPVPVKNAAWSIISKFRIVDERYKPKDEPQQSEVSDLPPGTQCEYVIFPSSRGFKEGYFVGLNSSGNIVIEHENGELKHYHKRQIKLRPLKSEREKFIEAAIETVTPEGSTVTASSWFGKMFDAGFRAPEGN